MGPTGAKGDPSQRQEATRGEVEEGVYVKFQGAAMRLSVYKYKWYTVNQIK